MHRDTELKFSSLVLPWLGTAIAGPDSPAHLQFCALGISVHREQRVLDDGAELVRLAGFPAGNRSGERAGYGEALKLRRSPFSAALVGVETFERPVLEGDLDSLAIAE